MNKLILHLYNNYSNINLYTYKDDTVSNGQEYFNGVYANNRNTNEELLNL